MIHTDMFQTQVMMDLLTRLTEALAPYGLNLVGTTTRAAYESLVPTSYRLEPLLPQTQTVIVIGNGGSAFWTTFRPYADRHAGDPHPLDDYTVEIIEHSLTPILKPSGRGYRYVYPFRFGTEPVSFMHLAQAAGLAGPSILGIMIHPVYGPWLALRAAVLVAHDLSHPPSAPGFNPCPSCIEKPCIQACPAGVIGARHGWNISGCAKHRLAADQCAAFCHARHSCVYGRKHRYPPDALRHHQAQSLATMRQYEEEDDKSFTAHRRSVGAGNQSNGAVQTRSTIP